MGPLRIHFNQYRGFIVFNKHVFKTVVKKEVKLEKRPKRYVKEIEHV